MLQPRTSYHTRLAHYPFWAADNGAFTTSEAGFSAKRFRSMLAKPELTIARDRCRFVVAPDRLVVLDSGVVLGDAAGTLEQFTDWSHEIRALGFPVALVAQNGLEALLDLVPWDLVDVLFIGGDDEWKLGPAAAACVDHARGMGKTSHMGRVNSYERLAKAAAMMCDSADGTFLRFGPDINLPKLLGFLADVRSGVQLDLPLTGAP